MGSDLVVNSSAFSFTAVASSPSLSSLLVVNGMTAMLVNRDQKPLWALWGDDEEGSATSSSSLRFPTNDSVDNSR
jgi:hypothetical protein